VTDIPEVVDTGSEGSQTASSVELLPIETKNPFEQQPIQEAARGLAMTHPRSLGGEVGARFMAASISHLSNELQETKRELAETRNKLETTRNELFKAKSDVAVLTEKISSMSGVRHLKNVSIAAGIILIGVAIDFSRNEFDSMSVVLAVIGLLMIIMGWVAPKGGKE